MVSMKDYLNQLGSQRIPFLFIIDFDKQRYYVSPIQTIDDDIFFNLNGFANFTPATILAQPRILKKNLLIGKDI